MVRPVRNCGWALFLDVDGTLLEIATGPDAVCVPARTRYLLQTAQSRESGAVALVSGRTIADLDRLFDPMRLPVAGVHGLERRDAAGRQTTLEVEPALLDDARERIAPLLAAHTGLRLEDKRCSLALHFRQVPHLEPQARAVFDDVMQRASPHFHLQTGKYCLEIKPAVCSKRSAIEAFMGEPPFAGRLPVFVGDDDTDEEGFEAVNELGGLSMRVGHKPVSAARWQFTTVKAVLRWLHRPEQPEVCPMPRDGFLP
ncbi:MAG: trehalose-phosphatase [Steroidobacteraceae bacterium]